jgi:hypothetical protein
VDGRYHERTRPRVEECKVIIVDRHEPHLELVGKGFKAIGYSLRCPGCGHSNTVALMEYWACYDCGATFYNQLELSKGGNQGGN